MTLSWTCFSTQPPPQISKSNYVFSSLTSPNWALHCCFIICGCESPIKISLTWDPCLRFPPLMLLTLIPKIKQCMAYQARIYRYVCTDICINQCWHMVVIHKFNETTVCLRIGRWVMAGGQQLRYKYVAAEKKAGGRIFGLFLLGPPPTRSTTTRLNWKLTSVVIWQQGASYFGQNAR